MSEYRVSSDEKSLKQLDYGATGTAALLQSAAFLLSLHVGTCPMSRQDGWEPPIDEPSPLAQGKSTFQIIQMFAQHLPELIVESIEYEHDSETGKFIPHVKVVIDDGTV